MHSFLHITKIFYLKKSKMSHNWLRLIFPLLLLAGLILQPTVVNMDELSTLYKYNISGTLYCSANGVERVMPNHLIGLWEQDSWPNLDDNLGSAFTDLQGHFELLGEEDEGNEPETFLRILHQCFDDQLPSGRVTRVWLPPTPVCQNLSIYLGKNTAVLIRPGHPQGDLPLVVTFA